VSLASEAKARAEARRVAKAKLVAQRARAHEKYVQKTYGLGPGEYAQMLAAQNGVCAICMRPPRRRRLAVDHDHNTGKPRALLCYLCNKYLGQWEFDPVVATLASQYLAAIADDYGDHP
jgi:hypothetical protein